MKISNLSVKQLAKSTSVAQALANQTTILSDRSLKTNIVVQNGDTAVLGGLIRDEETTDETKVPILGDIPVLGWLFKSSKLEKKKINLVVFLTPKIIRSNRPEHSRTLFNAQANDRVDWIKRNYSGRDPYGKKIDSLPRGMANTEMDESDEPIRSKSNNGRKPVKAKQGPKKIKR